MSDYVPDEWHYFPRGPLCLLGVRGYGLRAGADIRASNNANEMVTFTLCENFPPYRELRTFRPVRVEDAEARRTALVYEHIPSRGGRDA